MSFVAHDQWFVIRPKRPRETDRKRNHENHEAPVTKAGAFKNVARRVDLAWIEAGTLSGWASLS